jgi:hypothetical protein
MERTAAGLVVRQLESLFDGASVAGLSDRQLLERYNAGGRTAAGEAAFTALVARHGPMVMGVCRQLLGDAQHRPGHLSGRLPGPGPEGPLYPRP